MGSQDSPSETLDPATFERLLMDTLPRAYRAACAMTGDPVEAEDVVQDAALQAFKGRSSFRVGTNFRAWFMKVLLNAFLMRHRKERKQGVHVSFEDVPEAYLYSHLSEVGLQADPNTTRTFFRGLDLAAITSALAELPLSYRAVASLYFVEDLSYTRIAEILECPVGTVRSRLHRARATLQRSLWQTAIELGVIRRSGE
jgi:RNA polymerase sigma-70 factor (ECF subfamily)